MGCLVVKLHLENRGLDYLLFLDIGYDDVLLSIFECVYRISPIQLQNLLIWLHLERLVYSIFYIWDELISFVANIFAVWYGCTWISYFHMVAVAHSTLAHQSRLHLGLTN